MIQTQELYEKIDELLDGAGSEGALGNITLKETVEITTAGHQEDDRLGIMATKIGHFASGLFPRLPTAA